jgi:two-component sensor histidine kinase
MKYSISFIVLLFCLLSNNTFAQILSGEFGQLYQQGKMHYVNKEFAEASEVFDQLIKLGKESEAPYELAQIYYQMGVFYDTKKIQNKALKFLFAGVKILVKSISNPNSKSFYVKDGSANKAWGLSYSSENLKNLGAELLCDIYNRIGGVYYNQENYTKAEKYWKELLVFSRANNDRKSLSNAFNNLGEIYRLRNYEKKALHFYLEALEIKKEIKDSFGISINVTNVAAVYLKLGKIDSAKLFYDQSYILSTKLNSDYLKMGSYHNYGIYYQEIGELKAANKSFSRALRIAQKIKDINFTLDLFKNLALLYEKQLFLDSALYYHKEWIALNKEITTQENKKLVLEIEAEYLISKKEKELVYLRDKTKIEAQNTQLSDRIQWGFSLGLLLLLGLALVILRLRDKNNKKLEAQFKQINQQNEEKDIMLKEIHHRVKNNLQVITSLLSLQAYSIDDQKTKELFSYSQYRINSMAMIHEMLYQSDSLTKINYKDYLEQLIESLVTSMKGIKNKIQVVIDTPHVYLNIDTAIPLGLLINEIITNSLKYGMPEHSSGILSIKIKELEYPEFCLEIGDDGKGFSNQTNDRTSNSLGLSLIRKLTVQLNGNIEKVKDKKGTNYRLVFQEIT